MSNSGDAGETQIVFRVDSELEEQFMLAYRRAATEGVASAKGTRSEALRQAMRAVVNDPMVLEKGSTDGEIGYDEDS